MLGDATSSLGDAESSLGDANVSLGDVQVEEKLASVRTTMREKGAAALIVSTLDQVAWLLNVRGGDVAYCPVTLAYCVVRQA